MSNNVEDTSASFVRSGLWLAGSQVAVFAFYFLSQQVILSTLTKEENGTFVFERRIAELIICLFVELGLNGVALRRCARQPELTAEILSSVTAVRLVMWVVGSVVACAVGVWYGYDPLPILIWGAFALLASRTTLLRYVLELPSRVSGAMRFVAAMASLDAVLAFILVFLFREHLTPTTAIVLMFVAVIPGFLFSAFGPRAPRLRLKLVSPSRVRSMLSEALPMIVSRTIILVDGNVEFFVLASVATAASVGIVGAVHTVIGPAAIVIPLALSLAAAPMVARSGAKSEESRKAIQDLIRITLLASIGISATLDALMPTIIEYATSGRYSENTPLFATYAWSAPLSAIIIITQEVSVALKRSPVFTFISVVSIISSVSLSIGLIPVFDTWGAIGARLTTQFILAVVSVIALSRLVPGILRGSRLLQMVLLGLLSLGTVYFIRGLVHPIVAGLIVFLAVATLAVFLRLIGRRDIDFVVSRIRGRGSSDE